jgi:hypothetical protein
MSSHSTGSEFRSESPRVVFTVAPPSVASWSPSDSSLDTADRSLPPVARSLLSISRMVVQSFADVSSPSIVPTDVSSVTLTRRPTRAPITRSGPSLSHQHRLAGSVVTLGDGCAIPSSCRAGERLQRGRYTGCERSRCVTSVGVSSGPRSRRRQQHTAVLEHCGGISHERLCGVELIVSGERFYLIFPNDNTRSSRSRVLSPTVSTVPRDSWCPVGDCHGSHSPVPSGVPTRTGGFYDRADHPPDV